MHMINNNNKRTHNLEWVSYEENVALPIPPIANDVKNISFDYLKDKIKLRKRVDENTVELNHYEISMYWKILESKHDEFLTIVYDRTAAFLNSAVVYYTKNIDIGRIDCRDVSKHCTKDYVMKSIIITFDKNNNFEDIEIIFTFNSNHVEESFSCSNIYLSSKRAVFKEQEECLEYLKKTITDNLILRNEMVLDNEIDKINKSQYRE